MKKGPYNKSKAATVMREYYEGKLHHGGSGKIVKDPKVAKAIAVSEGRRVLKMKRKA